MGVTHDSVSTHIQIETSALETLATNISKPIFNIFNTSMESFRHHAGHVHPR